MPDFEPKQLHDGLAIYASGAGAPLFLMPYPHGFGRAPIVQEPLAAVLHELNQQIVSFDPPGMFNTARPAQVSMPEMVNCAEETLHEHSGHYPFTEERDLFRQILAEFLA